MPAFVWPTYTNPSPGIVARFGRVIHWFGVLLFAVAGAFAIYSIFAPDMNRWSVPVSLIYGAVIYLPFRGARYILAGE